MTMRCSIRSACGAHARSARHRSRVDGTGTQPVFSAAETRVVNPSDGGHEGLRAVAALCVTLMALTNLHAKPAMVTAYPMPAIYPASQTYSLKANGKTVPVVAFSNAYDYAVMASADGACQLE